MPNESMMMRKVSKLLVKELLINGFILCRLTNITKIKANRTRALIKDCEGGDGMASPKQPQEVTTSKNAEKKVKNVKNSISSNKPQATCLPAIPNRSRAPRMISKAQTTIAIHVL